MPDLGLKSFDKLYPMMIRKYQDLIIDQNASEADKINSIILKLNSLGKLSNDVVRDWNTVYNWAMNDGLNQDVSNKLETMKANGEFDNLVSAVVALVGDVTTLTTTAKDTTVNAINEVNALAKTNKTNIGDLTTLQTADKDTIVHAINDNSTKLNQRINNTDNDGIIKVGIDAGKNAPANPVYTGTYPFYKNIAIGGKALQSATGNKNNIAIGWNTLNVANQGEMYNIGIGNESLYSLSRPTSPSDPDASTRNIAIGINSQRFNTEGSRNVAVGRNSLQTNVKGVKNTAVGQDAMSGSAPIDLSGNIVNLTKYDTSFSTAIGYSALSKNISMYNSAFGANSGENIAKAQNVTASGYRALNSLQKDMTTEGTNKTYASKTGTYSWNGTTVTVTMSSHGFATGYNVSLALTSGSVSSNEEVIYPITVVDTNTFTINAPVSNTTTGNCSSSWYSDNTANTKVSDNNVAIGAYAMENTTSGTNNVAVGTWANRNNDGSDMNTMIGTLAGTNLTTGGTNTAVGYGSMRLMQDGTNAVNVNGSTALGTNAKVSGNNQVQLGDSGTTSYAYGAVQDRSDMRDKTDIRDTALGLDFINKIRPVDFKWNMRDDYIQLNEETGEVTVLPNDGSKKRNRYHHGVIAQEVKAVIDQSGVDFGGFQDHKVNGGTDVLTIGYEEFIAPLIKAVQELTAKVQALESKL